MVKTVAMFKEALKQLKQRLGYVVIGLLLIIGASIWIWPQQFSDLWLTRDQQGQLWFYSGDYQRAALTFNDTRWRAYSLYGGEEFDNATLLFGQFDSPKESLAKSNSMAHARRYVKARNGYASLIDDPEVGLAAQKNLKLVQQIIDDNNRLSDSQQAQENESFKDLDDKPQTGDGSEKKVTVLSDQEKFNAKQLLQDKQLNQLWLRGVQKDPARFLSRKFHYQNFQQQVQKKAVGNE